MVDKRFYQHLGPFDLLTLIDGLDVSIAEGQLVDISIASAAPLDMAALGDISFFEGRTAKLSKIVIGASACLVTEEHAALVGAQNAAAIISETPRADFARILSKLYKPVKLGSGQGLDAFGHVDIAKGAVIGHGVTIGEGTSIGPNAVIGDGVCLGKNCTIGANVVIEFSTLGNNCTVNHGTVLGGSGFGVAAGGSGGVDIPHVGIVVLEDDVSVGCLTAIDRAMFGATHIGKGCKFDNLVQIAHNCTIGAHSMFAAHVGIAGSCNIGKGVIMGGKAGMADHINIGDGAVLAAGSLTMRDVPAGEMWSGYPAMPIRQHMRQVSMLRKQSQKKS